MSAKLVRKLIADAKAADTPDKFEAVRDAAVAAERSGGLTEGEFGKILRAAWRASEKYGYHVMSYE